MATFNVHVTIENKPGISDPEGETILNDLVLKGTHSAISKIKDDLLEKAILNAQSKAEKALSPLNYKIIGVKEISLSEFSMPYPMPMYDMAYGAMEKSAAPTPIFSSDQDVSTSANVVFLIGSN